MATAVSIAIRRDAAQERIQAASIELAAKYGVEGGDLSPFHKDADQRMVRTLEAIADFLERLVAQPFPQSIASLPRPRPQLEPSYVTSVAEPIEPSYGPAIFATLPDKPSKPPTPRKV